VKQTVRAEFAVEKQFLEGELAEERRWNAMRSPDSSET
jgi:hypothetical protein